MTKYRDAYEDAGQHGAAEDGMGAKSWVWMAWVALAGVIAAMAPRTVRAEDVVYKKHTVVDFGDDTIEGDLSKPDGAYLESRKRLRHQRLIKVRENFRPEILESVRGL